MNNNEIFELAKTKGFKDLSISGGKSQSQSLKFERGVFEEIKEAYSDAIILVTYKDGNRMATSVSRPTVSKINEALDNINELHPFKTKEIDEAPLNPEGLIYLNPKKSKFEALSIPVAKKIMKKITDEVNKTVPGIIKNNTVVYYGVSASDTFKTNSKGMNLKSSSGQTFYFTIGVFVEKGEEKSSTYSSFVYKVEKDIDLKDIVSKVKSNSLSSLEKQEIKSGDFKVVLDRGVFMSAFTNMSGHLNARTVIDNISVWKDSLGKSIASANVTIADVPIMDELGVYITYDSDGFPTKEKNIVDKGILKTFIHNAKTAKILNQENTGNSSGQGASPYFLIMESGTKTDKEIIGSVKNGILIKELMGFHSGINTTSGDFSFEISANVIENGEVKKAIKTGVVSGNFFKDILNNVEDISSERNFCHEEINPMVILDKKLPIAV